jgi:DNA-binding response OmpR family regulator
VLLVEDDPGVQDKLRQAAEDELLELAVESEGRAALATARSFKPDLAILDVGLP